jgi:YVTN family beta-propeller protein
MARGAHAKPRTPSRRSTRGRSLRNVAVVAVLIGAATLCWLVIGRSGPASSTALRTPTTQAMSTSQSAPSTVTTTTVPGPAPGSKPLRLVKLIGGPISPKSVVATTGGLVFAQNMMYRHTVTVYTSSGELRRTISDSVNLSHFGVTGHPGVSRGAPVEAAITPDHTHVWVSNYSMYGVGFGPEGSDTCTPSSGAAAGYTDSYLYRVSLHSLTVDAVAKVGWVPKYVAVTPDGRFALASNWCSFDLSVVSTKNFKTVARIPIGAYPRGIAVSNDSRYAYVAIMGGSSLAVVDLHTMHVVGSIPTGSNPRHVVISPNGQFLYVTLNAPGDVVKILRKSGRVLGLVHTGVDCRSLAISSNGTTLYVVNYLSNTMSMVRASDLHVLQTVHTGTHPVGVTYDPVTGRVWVAVYTGQLMLFGA